MHVCVYTPEAKKPQLLTPVRTKIKNRGLLQRAVCSSLAEAVLEVKVLHAETDSYISILAKRGNRGEFLGFQLGEA